MLPQRKIKKVFLFPVVWIWKLKHILQPKTIFSLKSIIYYNLGLLLGVLTIVCEGVFASSKYCLIDEYCLLLFFLYCSWKTISGYVTYSILTSDAATCLVKLFDKSLSLVAQSPGCRGNLTVTNAHLWWPALTCNETPGYLYSLKVGLTAIQCNVLHRLNSR